MRSAIEHSYNSLENQAKKNNKNNKITNCLLACATTTKKTAFPRLIVVCLSFISL